MSAMLGLLGILPLGLAGMAHPAGADAVQPPFVQGRHVYDFANILSAASAAQAEKLAQDIETLGGGRVVVYLVADPSLEPDDAALMSSWKIDGMLISGWTEYGGLTLGSALEGRLDQAQTAVVSDSSGPQTVDSWVMSTLARTDAFLNGRHVFDGAGALDPSGLQQAETAATELAGKLKAGVYVDIAIGGDDPSTAASFNSAALSSHFGKDLVIALGVSGTTIGGSIDSSGDLSGSYHTGSPWTNSNLDNETISNGDVQNALLKAIAAVHGGSSSGAGGADVTFWIVIVTGLVAISMLSAVVLGPWLIRRLTATDAAGASAAFAESEPAKGDDGQG